MTADCVATRSEKQDSESSNLELQDEARPNLEARSAKSVNREPPLTQAATILNTVWIGDLLVCPSRLRPARIFLNETYFNGAAASRLRRSIYNDPRVH
jgi:hypothetical protein